MWIEVERGEALGSLQQLLLHLFRYSRDSIETQLRWHRDTVGIAILHIEIEGVDIDRGRGGTRIAAAAPSSPAETVERVKGQKQIAIVHM